MGFDSSLVNQELGILHWIISSRNLVLLRFLSGSALLEVLIFIYLVKRESENNSGEFLDSKNLAHFARLDHHCIACVYFC